MRKHSFNHAEMEAAKMQELTGKIAAKEDYDAAQDLIDEALRTLGDGNADELNRILVKGATPEQVANLEFLNNLTPEQSKLLIDYLRLREKTHHEMIDEKKRRMDSNPKATEDELNAGLYAENLEPQVREAVFKIRRKGYPTFESGFYGVDTLQKIGLLDDSLKSYSFPNEFIEKMRSKGVLLENNESSIKFHIEKYLSMEELKEVWNEIANILPDLGQPATPSSTPGAIKFRNRQNEQK